MTVYCRDCGNVHSETRRLEPWYWRCVMVPTEPGYRFVSPDYSPAPPYERCDRINTDGECPMFEPARQVEKPNG